MERLKKDVGEEELITCFIDPILQLMFHDPEQGLMFRWLNRSVGDSSASQRLDGQMLRMLQRVIYYSAGFVEVKPQDRHNSSTPLTHEDTLCLVTFCSVVVCKAYVHQHVPEDYMHIWLHTHNHVDTQRVPGQAIVTFDLATRHVVCLLVDHRLCTGNTQLNMRQTLYCQDPLNAYNTSRSSLYVCTLHQIFHTRTY